MFKQYMHIEKFGNGEVQGIELGDCYIFPKLDGTNASVWIDENGLNCGSRKRQISLDADNAGFCDYINNGPKYDNFVEFLGNYSDLRLFGEWLVPHSLKTYSQNAWRKFYVFDVYDDFKERYLSYHEYYETLQEYEIDFIPAMSILKNSTYERFLVELQNNMFLIPDGKGIGEGVVIKNYDYHNKFGRQCFAKIITNEFKEKHQKAMGPNVKQFKELIEQDIVDKYVESHLVEKVYAKIVNECDGWNSRYIPRLLNTVYYDLVNEELWNIVKKMKNPTINFKTLNQLTIIKIKQLKHELF